MCTMKCPRCGQTATKAKPQDQFTCESCGWKLPTPVHSCLDEREEFTEPAPDFWLIRASSKTPTHAD